MSAGVTDYGAATWLGIMFGLNSPPATLYLALCLNEPGVAMDGDLLTDLEPDDPSYVRVAIPVDSTAWVLGDNYVTNLSDVPFAQASVDWGTPTHYALCTAVTGGDFFCWGELDDPEDVVAGQGVTMPAGGIVVSAGTLDAVLAV